MIVFRCCVAKRLKIKYSNEYDTDQASYLGPAICTLVLEVFLDISPHGRAAKLRSREHESRSGEKEKPLVTLDLNLTFMQTPGSGSDPRARIG